MRRENDRYRNLRGLVARQTQEEQEPKKAKRDWTCWECGKGILKMILFPKRDGHYYFRRCTTIGCGHRTKMQKHNEEVEES